VVPYDRHRIVATRHMANLEVEFMTNLGDTDKTLFLHNLWGIEVDTDESVNPRPPPATRAILPPTPGDQAEMSS
jgi:hypothetical protein